MNPEVLAVLAVVAIISFTVRRIVKIVMDADIRKIELRHGGQPQGDGVSSSELQKLRDEIAQLRETTTQHALSLQHSVERLDHRVEFVERRVSDVVTADSARVDSQQLGVRS